MLGDRQPYNPHPYPWQFGLLAFAAFALGLFQTLNVFATHVASAAPRSSWQTLGRTTYISPSWAFGVWLPEKKKCAYTPAQCPPEEHAWLDDVQRATLVSAGATAGLTFILFIIGEARRSGAMFRRPQKRKPAFIELYLGRALGVLQQRGHKTSVQRGTELRLIDGDACQAIIVFGGIGAGKSLDHATPILTPSGYRPIGELTVGDVVFGRDGKRTRVIGVYPQGPLPAYRVHFEPGVSTVCSEDHLWTIVDAHGDEATVALHELVTLIENTNAPLAIPLPQPIDFPQRALPDDPYAFGRRIAADADRSREPIPHEFLYAHIAARAALLRGITEDCARAPGDGAVLFTTSSARLARDVAFLVHSLGGEAVWQVLDRGRIRSTLHRVTARCTILDPVPLGAPSDTAPAARRIITAVEPLGQSRDMVCIEVDSPDHLYVAEHGVLTHNTSSMLNRLVNDILAQDTGVLFFDVKGDWGKTIAAIAGIHKRELTRIGIGGVHFNLIHGLTPEIAASFLKSVMILAGQNSPGAAVYLNTSVDLARAILGLLSFSPYYTLSALRKIVFSSGKGQYKKAFEDYQQYVRTDEQLDRYNRYGDYLRIFAGFEERIQNGARTTLSAILDAFNLPEIEAAFCATGDNQLGMEQLLDGKAFVLDVPIAKYGFSAKTIYTMVKLRYFNVIDRRRSEPTWNQTRPIAYICDEYQEIVSVAKDAMSDLNFWDKARSARNIGIISGQGYTSFRAVIGDDDLTQAMFQNFRQKISFTHEDPPTRKLFQDILGNGLVLESQRSDTRGSTAGGFSRNTQRSKRLVEIDVVDEQLIRDMGRGKALAVLQINGKSYDDVIETPYFEPTPIDLPTSVLAPTGPRSVADAKKAAKNQRPA